MRQETKIDSLGWAVHPPKPVSWGSGISPAARRYQILRPTRGWHCARPGAARTSAPETRALLGTFAQFAEPMTAELADLCELTRPLSAFAALDLHTARRPLKKWITKKTTVRISRR